MEHPNVWLGPDENDPPDAEAERLEFRDYVDDEQGLLGRRKRMRYNYYGRPPRNAFVPGSSGAELHAGIKSRGTIRAHLKEMPPGAVTQRWLRYRPFLASATTSELAQWTEGITNTYTFRRVDLPGLFQDDPFGLARFAIRRELTKEENGGDDFMERVYLDYHLGRGRLIRENSVYYNPDIHTEVLGSRRGRGRGRGRRRGREEAEEEEEEEEEAEEEDLNDPRIKVRLDLVVGEIYRLKQTMRRSDGFIEIEIEEVYPNRENPNFGMLVAEVLQMQGTASRPADILRPPPLTDEPAEPYGPPGDEFVDLPPPMAGEDEDDI